MLFASVYPLPPRHLLSFPTRRSSDLSNRSSSRRASSPEPSFVRAKATSSAIAESRSETPLDPESAFRIDFPRSEEHTSELQSRLQPISGPSPEKIVISGEVYPSILIG